MDSDQSSGETTERLLYTHVAGGLQRELERAYDKREALWRPSPGDLEDTAKKVKTCGALLATQRKIASRLVLWEPLEGNRNRGKQSTTYIDNLLQDTGMADTQELSTLMEDRTE